MKRVLIICLLLLYCTTINSQKKDRPPYKYIKHSLGFLYFNDGLGKFSSLERHYGINYGIYAYTWKNVFFNVSFNKSSAVLTQDLSIDNNLFLKDSLFHFSGINIHIGYCFNINDLLSIEPYIGLI